MLKSGAAVLGLAQRRAHLFPVDQVAAVAAVQPVQEDQMVVRLQ
jgi:hypothetical protein